MRNQLLDQAIDELLKFHARTLELQKGYSKQGLLFALAVFKEAAYLDRCHLLMTIILVDISLSF